MTVTHRTYRTERKLPFGPLWRFCGYEQQATVAELVGLERRTISRYSQIGLPETRADEIAVRLGVHPSAIWGDLWWKGVPDGP